MKSITINTIEERLLSDQKKDYFFKIIWTIPAILKLVLEDSKIAILSLFVFLICSFKIIKKPENALLALPYFVILSPIAGFFNALGGKFLLSDFLFILLFIQFLFLVVQRVKNKLIIFNKLLTLLFLFFIASFVTGLIFNTLESLKPLLFLFQLQIIYFYTKTYAQTEKEQSSIIKEWIFATFLGGIILIYSFLTGKVLQDFAVTDSVIDIREYYEEHGLEYLFRATYYYSGFIFLVGISVIIMSVKIFFTGYKKKTILYLFVLFVLLLALILMNNKTVIFSLLIIICYSIFLLIKNGIINKRKFLINSLVVVCLLCFGMFPLVMNFFDSDQLSLMINRFTEPSSFFARTEVYRTALSQWILYPFQIFMGMGPDFLDNSGVIDLAVEFKKSAETGHIEGTVDSGWISYLIELGVLAFTILIVVYFKSMITAYKNFINRRRSSAGFIPFCVFLSLLFTLIAMSTQMLGYTKTCWLPFQLIIFGLSYKANDYSGMTNVLLNEA
ncbi:O-antigen ligase family protein [Asinibacterium sp. OR53]|uniref:O-antigen ligase family protein n=1 Tax=Asinibacterium sp. OR53 TaxID=925409 RepID=UPI0004795B38|nr:O-antigen ligase family protein [Asinibacterium sp. OR53]